MHSDEVFNILVVWVPGASSAVATHAIHVQCHRGRSLDAFFEGIQSDPVKLAVVGCGCSVATEPVAEISHRWNISQVDTHDIMYLYLCGQSKSFIFSILDFVCINICFSE